MAIALAAGEATIMTGQSVRETVEVDVISVSLRARDKSGNGITALRAADLSLRVDGVSVPIETLTSASLEADGTAPGSVNTGSPQSGQQAEVPRLAPSLPRYFVIVADEGETASFDMRDAYDQVIAFLSASVAPNDHFLVARFAGGDLGIEQAWTSEATVAAREVLRLRSHLSIERLPTGGAIQSGRDSPPLVWIETYRGRLRRAILEAISLFPQGPGRRELVLVTGGAALLRAPDLAQTLYGSTTAASTDVPREGRPETASERTERQQTAFELWDRAIGETNGGPSGEDVVHKATERDVAIVPVAAEALGRGLTVADARAISQMGAGNARLSGRLAVGQAMTSIAEDTGGEAILSSDKLAKRLAGMSGEGFYTFTFRDPYPKTHVSHQIEIAAKPAGLRLDYRRTYRIPTDSDRALDGVIAQLATNIPAGGPMRATAAIVESRSQAGRPVSRLTVEYLPPAEREAIDQRDVEIIAVGKNSEGGMTRPIRWIGTATRSDGEGAFMATLNLGTAPENYRWSVAIRDVSTSLTSLTLVEP